MLNLDNRTRYQSALIPCWNADGYEAVLAVIKATYTIDDQGGVSADCDQAPVRFADEYFGAPAESSLRYEADIALFKPAADVVVNGTAHSPDGAPVARMIVGVRVGPIARQLVVTGDRYRDRLSSTEAEPFISKPVIYERALHGRQNPVGRGGSGTTQHSGYPMLPNIETRDRGSTASADPAGFGAIARHWWPRTSYAGTYDDEWMADRMPFLPLNFDHRFFQCAASGMQTSYLRGGEPVELVNLSPAGPLRFILQVPKVSLLLRYDDRRAELTAVADTLLIEPDASRAEVTLRAQIPSDGDALKLREIIVIESNATITQAFLKGKRILGSRRRDN